MLHPLRLCSVPSRTRQITSALVLSAFLSACGGGGSTDTRQATERPVFQNDGTTLRWSDRATWGGTVPQDGSHVTVPAGKTIILDTDINLQTLTINGKLVCAEQDLNINSRWIMVHGAFECGTDSKPYIHRLVMTLKGQNRAESVMGMGTKVLAAMSGGLISMHGEERTSWLMLDQTANAGARTIQVEYGTNWRKGDTIVISSTDDDMNHAEVRQITQINGKTLHLNAPLSYRHFGEVQTFSNANKTWTVDTRAEVGLLTRNIRIQGDAGSDNGKFGGHIMIMEGSIGLMSGVELYRMGQAGILARYPFHWHVAGNVAGQYFRNSTVRKSYSRCVTVHGSHNALVEDNVCYDHIGHGYFLEDGVETGNVFRHNLGLLTHRPSAALALIPSDIQDGKASRGPSTFWISNGDNTFIDNAAAGSDGLGFWYDTKNKPTGSAASMSQYKNVSPVTSKFGVFRDNRVHSSDMAFSSCTNSSGPVGYTPSNKAVYKNLTVFAGGDGAVWPCHGNQTFTNLMVTDTGRAQSAGFVAPRPVTVEDSLFVANSKLSEGGRGRSRSAIGLYDFGAQLRDIHFENFDQEYGGNHVFTVISADVRFTNTRASGLTFANSDLLYDRRDPALDMTPSEWGALVHDEDGSFGVGANTALVADHPIMVDGTCTDNYGTGKLCGNRYGRIEFDFDRTNLPALMHHRSDGVNVTATPHVERGHYQSIVAVNQNRYHYSYTFNPSVFSAGALKVRMELLHNKDTAVLEFTNLPSSTRIQGPGYTQADSLYALKSGPGRQFIQAGGSLFVKMQATGERWAAADNILLFW